MTEGVDVGTIVSVAVPVGEGGRSVKVSEVTGVKVAVKEGSGVQVQVAEVVAERRGANAGVADATST
jgi:hypothetical protein